MSIYIVKENRTVHKSSPHCQQQHVYSWLILIQFSVEKPEVVLSSTAMTQMKSMYTLSTTLSSNTAKQGLMVGMGDGTTDRDV